MIGPPALSVVFRKSESRQAGAHKSPAFENRCYSRHQLTVCIRLEDIAVARVQGFSCDIDGILCSHKQNFGTDRCFRIWQALRFHSVSQDRCQIKMRSGCSSCAFRTASRLPDASPIIPSRIVAEASMRKNDAGVRNHQLRTQNKSNVSGHHC